MAKATAICTCEVCGKQFKKKRRNLFKRRDADSWEEWAKAHYTMCPDCYRDDLQKYREEKAAREIEDGKRVVLKKPHMTGSKKQCEWAYSIFSNWAESYNSFRAEKLYKLDRYVIPGGKYTINGKEALETFDRDKLAKMEKYTVTGEEADKTYELVELLDAIAYCTAKIHTEASWWIANRNILSCGGNSLCVDFLKKEYDKYLATTPEEKDKEAEMQKPLQDKAKKQGGK